MEEGSEARGEGRGVWVPGQASGDGANDDAGHGKEELLAHELHCGGRYGRCFIYFFSKGKKKL